MSKAYRCNECACVIDESELYMACPQCGVRNDFEPIQENQDDQENTFHI